jgi:hypothetical protein
MAGLPALIGDDELDLTGTPPSLVDLVAQFGAPTDDDLAALAVLNSEAVAGFGEGAAGVAGLDALFTDVVSSAFPITVDTLAADTHQLAADLKTGDAVLADLDGLFSTPATKPAVPAPPVSGGGGGGVGGVGEAGAVPFGGGGGVFGGPGPRRVL